jgi:hypothetical protein
MKGVIEMNNQKRMDEVCRIINVINDTLENRLKRSLTEEEWNSLWKSKMVNTKKGYIMNTMFGKVFVKHNEKIIV